MITSAQNPDQLLPFLYAAPAHPDGWSPFLIRLAEFFNTGTACLRLLDRQAAVVHQSFSFGFSPEATRNYLENFRDLDPFIDTLEQLPAGKVAASHSVISDQDYLRSEHYNQVFRLNGNFYAMGSHVERSQTRSLQVGVHRPRSQGPFSAQECRLLEYFSPHLREAAKLLTLLDEYRQALTRSRLALDQLPYGVWELDEQLRCVWMNTEAEQALENQVYGLKTRAEKLTFAKDQDAVRLNKAYRALQNQPKTSTLTLKIAQGQAALVFVTVQNSSQQLSADRGCSYLAFLLDSQRQLQLDPLALGQFYQLTPAEVRLLNHFLQGKDLHEISNCLQVSLNTLRSQLKSILRKTETTRQAELMRKLLMNWSCLK
ncbi:helix-turn-helix transcriptional regulator [Marinospirillum celere]|nr:helix-turn-helix transcriptional regulator [Marinospirillum celere]